MKICITSTFDRNYSLGGKTLIKSIKQHTNCTGIDFKIITADPVVVKQFGAENCHFVDDTIKERYKNVAYIPELPKEKYSHSWYRYELFSFKGYDRVICLDSDCLCLRDMSYLFSEELSQYDIISVEDHIVSKVFIPRVAEYTRLGLNLTNLMQRVKNGQVDIQPALIIANKRAVNEEWYRKLLEYANTTPYTYSIDEGILNDFIYLSGMKVKLLPLEYDYQDCYETAGLPVPVPTNPVIVHCEESKPFKRVRTTLDARLHKWYDLWWKGNHCLDELAIKHKADKSSLYHNFAEKYDRLLSSVRESVTNIFEIGVGNGQSAKMWSDYFTNATIHVADIDPGCRHCESYSSRIKFTLMDQGNVDHLNSMSQFGPFDLIVDDGNHWWYEQIVSFNTLFPFVKKGGIYIVEDTCTSYWPEYNNNPFTCVDYFRYLVDDVNLKGARGQIPNNPSPDFGGWDKGWHRREDCHTNLPDYESIHFFNGFIVIHKRR